MLSSLLAFRNPPRICYDCGGVGHYVRAHRDGTICEGLVGVICEACAGENHLARYHAGRPGEIQPGVFGALPVKADNGALLFQQLKTGVRIVRVYSEMQIAADCASKHANLLNPYHIQNI